MWSQSWILCLLALSQAFAQQFAVDQVLDRGAVDAALNASNRVVLWSRAQGATESARIIPLREPADFRPGEISILYPFGDGSNLFSVNSTTIAFVSCDPDDYPRPGNVGPSTVYMMAVQNSAAAILLYSNDAPACNVSGPNLPPYDRVYTLTGPNDARRIRDQDAASPLNIIASIGAPANGQIDFNSFPALTSPGTVQRQAAPRSTNLNTQVAMIILYTVTGVVTALFLVIIVTGAVRAHRHPERYGPRNILGRPRQTRARGLARAMLDSLPIVKFGQTDDANKDVELANSTQQTQTQQSTSSPIIGEGNAETTAPQTATTNADRASVHSGIGPAEETDPITSAARQSAGPSASAAAPETSLGCSICTDDFEAGQDVRVLPCDHKFHPACVDPWLLNVSGTCPLCRIDLAPRSSTDDDDDDAADPAGPTAGPDGAELPPPLAMPDRGSRGGGGANNNIRASALLYYMQHNHNEPVFARDRDEILEALRRWRRATRERINRNSTASAGSVAGEQQQQGESAAEESRRRNRFSRVFGIRTRREGNANGNGSVVATPVVPQGETPEEGTRGADRAEMTSAAVPEPQAALEQTGTAADATSEAGETGPAVASRPATAEASNSAGQAQAMPTEPRSEQRAEDKSADAERKG